MPDSPRIAIVLLCAGGSSRFGSPKQLASIDGRSLISNAATSAENAGASTIVVLGANAEVIRPELVGQNVIICENTDWRLGMGGSIRAGIRQANEHDAAIISLCDLPAISTFDYRKLIEEWKRSGKPIVASEYGGTIGVPALFAKEIFPELLALGDDHGAKAVILRDPVRVATVACTHAEWDIDTPGDLKR